MDEKERKKEKKKEMWNFREKEIDKAKRFIFKKSENKQTNKQKKQINQFYSHDKPLEDILWGRINQDIKKREKRRK